VTVEILNVDCLAALDLLPSESVDCVAPTKFGVILADPPWAFKTWSGKTGTPHRSASDHYVTTATAELCDLPVKEWAAPNSALFMWVVDSHLEDAFGLAAAWGFRFKTIAFVWSKLTNTGLPHFGMGYWTRKQTETCLLFTRGAPKRLGKGVRQLIQAPRREHSRKPDEQYERIETLVAGPYLEIFARQTRPGWTAWGNETGKFGQVYDKTTDSEQLGVFG
jgi:N6-adenosine-specific RNA methylase IME4